MILQQLKELLFVAHKQLSKLDGHCKSMEDLFKIFSLEEKENIANSIRQDRQEGKSVDYSEVKRIVSPLEYVFTLLIIILTVFCVVIYIFSVNKSGLKSIRFMELDRIFPGTKIIYFFPTLLKRLWLPNFTLLLKINSFFDAKGRNSGIMLTEGPKICRSISLSRCRICFQLC